MSCRYFGIDQVAGDLHGQIIIIGPTSSSQPKSQWRMIDVLYPIDDLKARLIG